VFPISEDRLSLAQLAEFWAQEMRRPVPVADVHHFLCQAWWRGEFRGVGPSRLDVLKQLRWGPFPDRDPDSWTEADCAPAFAAIEASWPREPGTPLVFTAPFALAEIRVPRAEFAAWVIEKGYDRPNFWGEFPAGVEVRPKATASKAAPPGAPRKRGPKPTKREGVAAKMQNEIDAKSITKEQLERMLEKELTGRYHVSRDTARKARNDVLRST
jgi:hypothetical protein